MNSPRETKRLAAQIELYHQHVPQAVAAKITELYEGGLELFEIQSVTGIALPLIRLVLRGAPPGGSK